MHTTYIVRANATIIFSVWWHITRPKCVICFFSFFWVCSGLLSIGADLPKTRNPKKRTLKRFDRTNNRQRSGTRIHLLLFGRCMCYTACTYTYHCTIHPIESYTTTTTKSNIILSLKKKTEILCSTRQGLEFSFLFYSKSEIDSRSLVLWLPN